MVWFDQVTLCVKKWPVVQLVVSIIVIVSLLVVSYLNMVSAVRGVTALVMSEFRCYIGCRLSVMQIS